MQLSELRAAVRVELREASAKYWTDSEIDYWLNEAAAIVASRLKGIEGRRTASTVSGQQMYDLPTDCYKVNRVIVDDIRLTPMRKRPEDLLTTSGTPREYLIWGDNLFLNPAPSSAGTDNIVVWGKFGTESMSADTDTPGTPVVCDYALVHYACAKAWGKRKDDRKVQRKLNDFASVMAELQDYANDKLSDGAKRISRNGSWYDVR